MGSAGDGGGAVETIGFTMPEMDFLEQKLRVRKFVLVHFGPATMTASIDSKGNPTYTPFSRMTALTIRNRLSDLISDLPSYTLFNIAAFFSADTWAMSPNMITASSANKKKVIDWMQPVNPIDPEANDKYEHCFSIGSSARSAVNNAAHNWPTRGRKSFLFLRLNGFILTRSMRALEKNMLLMLAEFTVDKIKTLHLNPGKAFHIGEDLSLGLY